MIPKTDNTIDLFADPGWIRHELGQKASQEILIWMKRKFGHCDIYTLRPVDYEKTCKEWKRVCSFYGVAAQCGSGRSHCRYMTYSPIPRGHFLHRIIPPIRMYYPGEDKWSTSSFHALQYAN